MGIKRNIKRSAGFESVTIDLALNEFLMEKEVKNISQATLQNYEKSVVKFCKFFGFNEDTTVETIKRELLFKWIGTMKQEISVSSINHYLRDVRAFLYWCMDRGYLEMFEISELSKQEEPPKLFTDDDLIKLLEKPRKRDSFTVWRTWAIVNWVLGTGNREATVCEVRLGDVNYTMKEITLRHTKNKKAQIIPLSSSLETALREYIRMFRRDSGSEDFLFPNIGDEKLTTNGLRQSFTKYCKDREVSRHNFHGLRHNFAKGWVQNNGNMFALQSILGHSTLAMTRKYVKLFGEDIKEDFDKFTPLDTIKRNQKRTNKITRYE